MDDQEKEQKKKETRARLRLTTGEYLLPEEQEEKEKLNKYQIKATTKITSTVDNKTGEILSTETTYNSEKKRVKGTFYIGSPEQLSRLCSFNKKNRAISKMLTYIIDTVNWNNEFSFDKSFIESYNGAKTRFYQDRKYLLENEFIFPKPDKKNIYTLNVDLFSRGNAYVTSQLYKEQFGEELNPNSKLEVAKIEKSLSKLEKEDLKRLSEKINKLL